MLKSVFIVALALVVGACSNSSDTSTADRAPEFLYKIVTPMQWRESQQQQSVVLGEMDDTFIHLATEEQVERIAAKFFKDQPVIVLKLRSTALEGRLILESNPGGQTRYWHLYEGSIPLSAVVFAKM